MQQQAMACHSNQLIACDDFTDLTIIDFYD